MVEKFSGDEFLTDSESDSGARSDIMEGLKVRVSNPRNLAELGVSPRETGRPLLNLHVFDRDDLKVRLQNDLDIIRKRLEAREVLIVA
ncbi:hypothetical protein LguiB_008146 [Lonicera macranthoides]